MSTNDAEFAATELLKNMTQDMANMSGKEFDVGEFESVGDGVRATLVAPSGGHFRVTVECLGETRRPFIS